jgi:hypothetical protein
METEPPDGVTAGVVWNFAMKSFIVDANSLIVAD